MSQRQRPHIAVLMDENTSSGGTRYEAHKGYFHGLIAGGGAPFGIPYAPEMVADVVACFDGLLAVGGRFGYPNEWYVEEVASALPSSLRLDVERAMMAGFLGANKPVLGICAGMQMLACLNGCLLDPDIAASRPSTIAHDQRGTLHRVNIHEGTLLRRVVGATSVLVNSFHREAVASIGQEVVVSAHAEDGVIEAVELCGVWPPDLHADSTSGRDSLPQGPVK